MYFGWSSFLKNAPNWAAGREESLAMATVPLPSAADRGEARFFFTMACVQAAIIVTDNTFVRLRDRIAALARAAGIPSVYAIREHVVAGGLASYGPSLVGNYRASARYVAKILKGARPADLPVEQSTRFETVINRKAADALRIRIPTAMLLRADEVIE